MSHRLTGIGTGAWVDRNLVRSRVDKFLISYNLHKGEHIFRVIGAVKYDNRKRQKNGCDGK